MKILGIALLLACGAPALGQTQCLGDFNGDGTVTIAELITAINNALYGCDGGSPPKTCGDAAVMQAFASCVSASSEATCVSAGGSWGPYPFSRRPGCFCKTGQAGCSCSASGDCLGRCFVPGQFGGCDAFHEGTCSSEEPQAGCWCEFDESGEAHGFCNDP